MELIGGWIFFLFGISRLLLANRNLNKIFTIHEAVREHNDLTGVAKFNYDTLPQDAREYSVYHLIGMILFFVWCIGGMIWSDTNSGLFIFGFVLNLFSGNISRLVEQPKSLYVVWYTIYWGLFTIFNGYIIELLKF